MLSYELFILKYLQTHRKSQNSREVQCALHPISSVHMSYIIIVQYLNQEIEIGKMCLILSYV